MRNFRTTTAATAFTAVLAAAILIGPTSARADDDNNSSHGGKSLSRIGLEVAESSGIHLNMRGKDREKVGLGSYLVNVVADCNGCHAPPPLEYAVGGNPYLLPGGKPPFFGGTKRINPATYLGGGQSFGFFGPGPNAEIVSRNLTPDKTGRPEGGHTLAEFKLIMRTGIDLDYRHPSCSKTITTNCLAFPFNGALLQVMPWPAFQNMTDQQLEAIYVYLSAVQCLEGGPGEPANRCE